MFISISVEVTLNKRLMSISFIETLIAAKFTTALKAGGPFQPRLQDTANILPLCLNACLH